MQLISLQKGHGREQLQSLPDGLNVLDLCERRDEVAGPSFMDTAALMANLDLVVSSCTAVPHLAGALGVPVWIALSTEADFRWLTEREDSPWYPTLRLFRQREAGNWADVFVRIAAELRLKAAAPREAGPILA